MADDNLLSDEDMGLKSDADMGLSDQGGQQPPAELSDKDMGLLSDEDMGLHSKPEDSSLPGAVARDVVKGAAPFAAGTAGMTVGAIAGQAAIPIPVVGALVGAGVGGMAASALTSWGQDKLLEALGMKQGHGWFSDEQARADAEQHPWAQEMVDLGYMAGSFKYNPKAGLLQHGIGALGMGGMEAGKEAYTGEWDASKIASEAALGAVFTDPRSLTKKFQAPFERAGNRIAAEIVARTGRTAPTTGRASETEPPPDEKADVGRETGQDTGSETSYPKDNKQTNNAGVTEGLFSPDLISTLEQSSIMGQKEGPIKGQPYDPRGGPANIDTGIKEAFGEVIPPEKKPAGDTTPPEPPTIDATATEVKPEPPQQQIAPPLRRLTGPTEGAQDVTATVTEPTTPPVEPEKTSPASPAETPKSPEGPDITTAPPGLVYEAVMPGHMINRSQTVDTLSAKKGRTIYVDRELPRQVTVGGVSVDPAQALAVYQGALQNAIRVQKSVAPGTMSKAERLRFAHENAEATMDEFLRRAGITEAGEFKQKIGWEKMLPYGKEGDVRATLSAEGNGGGKRPVVIDSALEKLRERGQPHDLEIADYIEHLGVMDPEKQAQVATKALRQIMSRSGELKIKFDENYARTRKPSAPAKATERDVTAGSKTRAALIDRVLKAANLGFAKGVMPREFDPAKPADRAALKEHLAQAVEEARQANGGKELPHESYNPEKARKQGNSTPPPTPAAWRWVREAARLAGYKRPLTFKEASLFLANDRMYRSGNVEASQEAANEQKFKNESNMNKTGGDDAIAAAEADAAKDIKPGETPETNEVFDQREEAIRTLAKKHADDAVRTAGEDMDDAHDAGLERLQSALKGATRGERVTAQEAYSEAFDKLASDRMGDRGGAPSGDELHPTSVEDFTPKAEGKFVEDQAKVAENLTKMADKPAPAEKAGKPPEHSENVKAEPESVRKVEVNDDLKKSIMESLKKAEAKNKGEVPPKKGEKVTAKVTDPAAEFLAEHDAKTTSEEKTKTIGESVRDFLGKEDGGGPVPDFDRINKAFKVRRKEFLNFMNKMFGVVVNETHGYTDPILAKATSTWSKLSAEMNHMLDARWYQWHWQKPEHVWSYLGSLETLPKAMKNPTHADFYKDLVDRGVPPKKAEWMADEALFHRSLMDHVYNIDQNFVENYERWEGYVSHMYEDQKGVEAWLRAREQALGTKGFTKERTFDTIKEAVEAGFKLKYDNPIDIIQARYAASIRDWVIVGGLRRMSKSGLAYPADEKTPDWVKNSFVRLNATPDGVQWMIDPGSVNLWKNAMERGGLSDLQNGWGNAYRTWLKVKQVWAPIQLGLSLFHEVHIALNINPVENFQLAMRRAHSNGEWYKEMKTALKNSVTDPFFSLPLEKIFGGKIDDFFGGAFSDRAKVQGIWGKQQAEMTPEERTMQYLMEEAGVQLGQPYEDTISAGRAFAKSLKAQNYPGIIGNGIARGIQSTQDWMMKHQIPRMKALAVMREIQAAMMIDPTLATNTTKREAVLREIGKNVDDRYGEMFYKGMFWNKYLKDAGIGSFLSLSWNVGQVRQAGGAVMDLAAILGDKTGIKPLAGQRKARIYGNSRAAFVAAYVGWSMFTAGAMSWALSGSMPSGLDWIYPKNGEKNPDGTPQRLTVPYNTREPVMFWKHTEEAGSVLAGLWHVMYNKMIISPVIEAFQNQDYYGKQLYDTNAPFWKRVLQLGDSILGAHTTPISVGGIERVDQLGGGLRDKALAVGGFGPAPAYVSHNALQNRIQHLYYEQFGPHPYQYGKSGLGRGLVQGGIRNMMGDKTTGEARSEGYQKINRGTITGNRDLTMEGRRELVQGGEMSPKTAGTTRPEEQYQRMFFRLPIEHQRALFDQMDAADRDTYVYKNRFLGQNNMAKVTRMKKRGQP